MYYESNDIESILKCSFCQTKFTDVVKLVPDCGSSICGECYEALRVDLDESSRFKCKECQELHTLAKTGLGDNKLAMKMLEHHKKEKPLSEKATKLKSVLDQAEESIAKLQRYNDFEVINSYCNSLVQNILRSVENMAQHLTDRGTDLVGQVEKYREKLIASRSGNVKASNVERESRLDALSAEMSAFSREWSFCLTQNDDNIERAQTRIDKFLTKINELEEEIKNELFDGRFLEFQENQTLSFGLDHIGKLVYSGSDDLAKLDDQITNIVETHFMTLKNVNHVAFLPNDDFVTGSDKITVWSHESFEKLFELKHKSSSNVLSLAVLPDDLLASGQSDSSIVILDLEERKEVRCLTGHAQGVFTLKTLKNGDLASCAWDGIIKIWKPFLEDGNLIRTIRLLGSVGPRFDLGELPNGHLVALSSREALVVSDDELESEKDDEEDEDVSDDEEEESYSSDTDEDSDRLYETDEEDETGSQDDDDDDDDGSSYDSKAAKRTIQIWDPSSGNLVKFIDEHRDRHTSFCSLSNDSLAIGSAGSRIELVDLTTEGSAVELSSGACHVGPIRSLIQLPNGYLVSSGFGDGLFSTIKFWDPQSKKLIKTIKLNKYLAVDRLGASESGKLLACVQENMVAKIWRLNF